MNMSPITELILADYRKRQFITKPQPSDINTGDCTLWAMMAQKMYGGQMFYCHDMDFFYGGHCFLKLNNLFFDSESPYGISDWRELEYFKLHPSVWQNLKAIRCTPRSLIEDGWRGVKAQTKNNLFVHLRRKLEQNQLDF